MEEFSSRSTKRNKRIVPRDKTYKTVMGFLKHLAYLAKHQDMSDCKGWDKLSKDEQKMFYDILAGMQNDLGDMQRLMDSRNSGIKIYHG